MGEKLHLMMLSVKVENSEKKINIGEPIVRLV